MILIFRTILILVSFSLSAIWSSDDIHCSIKIKSSSLNFSKRLEKELHYQMEKDELFHFSTKELLGNNSSKYSLSFHYPVYPFPSKASLYVKIKNTSGLVRYLTISHHAKERANLSIDKQDTFVKKAVKILLQKVSIEANFRKGEKLKVGYYTNHKVIPLSQTLDIEVLDIKYKKQNQSLGLLDRTKIFKAKTKMLDENTPSSKIILKRKPISKHKLSENKLQTIQNKLDLEYKPEIKAKLYLDLTELYEANKNKALALKFANKSLLLFPTNEALGKVNAYTGESASPIHRFRLMNRKRKFNIQFDIEAEYDTNVVQEAVESFFHTNTTDYSFHTNFGLDKTWGFKSGDFENTTSYNLKNSIYTSHSSLDLMEHRLGHQWHTGWKNGEDYSILSFGGGYDFISRRSKSLLSGHDASFGFAHYIDSKETLLTSNLAYLKKDYTQNFFLSEETSGDTLSLSTTAQKVLGKKGKHRASITGRFSKERLGDSVRSNDAYGFDLAWQYKPTYFLKHITVFYNFENQKFKAIASGRTIARIDDKISTGFELNRTFYKNLYCKAQYKFTDNQSNERVYQYIRQQVSLSYGVLF